MWSIYLTNAYLANADPEEFCEHKQLICQNIFTTYPLVVSLTSLQKSMRHKTSYRSEVGKTVTTMKGTDGVGHPLITVWKVICHQKSRQPVSPTPLHSETTCNNTLVTNPTTRESGYFPTMATLPASMTPTPKMEREGTTKCLAGQSRMHYHPQLLPTTSGISGILWLAQTQQTYMWPKYASPDWM